MNVFVLIGFSDAPVPSRARLQEEAEILAKRAAEDPSWAGWQTGSKRICILPFVTSHDSVAGLRSHLHVVSPELKDRTAAFAKGGVFICNARLLVTDLLSGRLVPESVDGLFVNHAHGVQELSADAFVLRLYRLKNTRGFVRAISDAPDGFARGQVQVEKVMQRCFLNELDVWPRIRKEVQDSLSQESQPDVVQIKLELPKEMLEIQRHILNIFQSTLAELKKDPHVDLGDLDVKGSLNSAFESELKQVLDLAWQNLGPSARRLVNDLSGLRRLLTELLRGDAVDFLRLLDTLCKTQNHGQSHAAWLYSSDAQSLLALARGRVYEICREEDLVVLKRKLEPHAKWCKILEAIDRTIEKVTASEGSEVQESSKPCGMAPIDSDSDLEIVGVRVKRPRTSSVLEPRLLIIAPEDRSRRQLSNFLHRGGAATLLDSLGSYFKDGRDLGAQSREVGGLGTREAHLVAQEAEKVARELEDLVAESCLRMREVAGRACHPRVDVVAESEELEMRLEEMKPHAVIVFEPSLQAIRQVEVYHAQLHARRVKIEPGMSQEPVQVQALQVYLLAFEDSIETYRYQQSLLSESQAVDAIIRFRQHMTWRIDPPTEMAPPESSRRGGGARALQAQLKPRVVVDMRLD